jgi:hypothetical protein
MRFVFLVCARADVGLAKIAELINHCRRLIMIQCFYHKTGCNELLDQVRALGAIKDNTGGIASSWAWLSWVNR